MGTLVSGAEIGILNITQTGCTWTGVLTRVLDGVNGREGLKIDGTVFSDKVFLDSDGVPERAEIKNADTIEQPDRGRVWSRDLRSPACPDLSGHWRTAQTNKNPPIELGVIDITQVGCAWTGILDGARMEGHTIELGFEGLKIYGAVGSDFPEVTF